MKLSSRGVGIAAAASISIFGLLTPVSAVATGDPEDPPSNGSTVFVDPALEGTTIDRSTVPDTTQVVSPELQAQLEEYGLTGPVVTAEEAADGLGTYYTDGQAWVLDLGTNSNSKVASTQAFGYGIFEGYVTTPKHVSNYLQWGGQSSCHASDNHYYLHKVSSALYDTCVGPLCAFLTYRFTVNSPASSNFASVATAYGSHTCVNGNGRTYEQKVSVYVRSVAYGPFWQRDVVVNDCSVAP